MTKKAIWLLIKPNLNQSKIKSKSKQNQNEDGDLYINNNTNIFIKPNIEEIRKYIKEERRSNVDPQKFYDFYESKGWMVGKNKMKDWKACVRTWEQRQDGQAPLPNFVGKEYKKEQMSKEEQEELRKEMESIV
jgi:hypothetical protein